MAKLISKISSTTRKG